MQRRAMFWRNSRYIFITLAGYIVLFGCFYLFFLRGVYSDMDEKRDSLNSLTYKLGAYYGGHSSAGHAVPMDKYYQKIQQLKDRKKENVDKLKEILAIHPEGEYIINKGEYPGSYFKKILDQKRKDLLQESSKRDIEIPESLGFGEDLPPDKDADDLLKFLLIKEQLLKTAIRSGVESVSAIEHFSAVETGPDRENRFIREYPVRITLQASTTDTLEVLYKMRSEQQFLVLRNLEITSPNGTFGDRKKIMGVSIDVAGMIFTNIEYTEKQEKPPKKKAPGGGTESVKPLGI